MVVHYWADLQSMHGLRWYGSITRTRNVSKYMFVLALCLVRLVVDLLYNKLYSKIHNKSTIDRKLYNKSTAFHKILQLVVQ